jgi:cytochrome P450
VPDFLDQPGAEAAYFDPLLDAWVLSRYADVLAAFHEPALQPAGPNSKPTAEAPDSDGHAGLRAETQGALSSVQLRTWRARLKPVAEELVKNLPAAQPLDLLGAYGRPICLTLAAMVTRVADDDRATLYELSQPISAAAADPYDTALKASAKRAEAELSKHFHSGPELLRGSGFVALAHTLPCLLANVWFALIECPQGWSSLHKEPKLIPRAMEELLRHTGLPRTLFRRAAKDFQMAGIQIRQGQRVILRIMAANRDPEQFACPANVDLRRRGAPHLSLGAGPHACVGASLIRMAAVTMTRPLLTRFATAEVTRPVEWRGGIGFRTPTSLWVSLGEDQR